MSRLWNGKAFIDELAARLWDTSTANIERVRRWAIEIQEDLVNEIPQEHMRIKLKKLLPTEQEQIELSPDIPAASVVAISAGGNLTDGTTYKAYVTFVIYDEDRKKYIESEPSPASAVASPVGANLTIDVSVIPLYPTVKPATIDFTYPFTTPGNYTFNSALLEFSGTQVQTKEVTPTDEMFLANFTTKDLTRSVGGTLTGTLNGGAVIDTGKLSIPNIAGYWNFDLTGMTGSSPEIVTFRFKFTPLYSGSPANPQDLITEKTSSSNVGNEIEIEHEVGGNLVANFRNSASGGLTGYIIAAGWSPTSGVTYEIELNCNFSNGNGLQECFIDGVSQGAPTTHEHVRTSVAYFQVGRTGGNPQNFKIDDLQRFDTIQHTANYTPVASVPYPAYSTANPSVEPNAGIVCKALSSLAMTNSALVGTDSITITFRFNSIYYYLVGTTWTVGDGTFAQSSSLADINTNAETLDLSVGGTLDTIVFLHSADGATLISIDDLTITTSLSSIDDTAVKPATIYRKIYVAKLASGESAYGEPLLDQTIEDNTTTTATISTETTSTITPPSDTEVDQLTSDHLYFENSSRILRKMPKNFTRRYDPNSDSTSSTPDLFDYVGLTSIQLYPVLSSTATDAQRTLSYFVYRRPHEIHYDIDFAIDLPMSAKKALYDGVVWKGYEFRDRAGQEGKRNNYEGPRGDGGSKRDFINKVTRTKGVLDPIRDVSGDAEGFEI